MPPGPSVKLTLRVFGRAVKDNGITTGYAPAQLKDMVKPHSDGAHPLLAHQLIVK